MRKGIGGLLISAGLFAGAAAAARAADPAEGQKLFMKYCVACHDLTAKNKLGPNLTGIVGRTSGTVEGFKYSEALKKAAISWNDETLDKYIADPRNFVVGNEMGRAFLGVKKEDERENVIAYIKSRK